MHSSRPLLGRLSLPMVIQVRARLAGHGGQLPEEEIGFRLGKPAARFRRTCGEPPVLERRLGPVTAYVRLVGNGSNRYRSLLSENRSMSDVPRKQAQVRACRSSRRTPRSVGVISSANIRAARAGTRNPPVARANRTTAGRVGPNGFAETSNTNVPNKSDFSFKSAREEVLGPNKLLRDAQQIGL